MDSIYLSYFLKILSFIFFLYLGSSLLFKYLKKKELSNLIIGIILLVICLNNFIAFIDYPSLNSSKKYFTNLQKLDSSQIKEVYYENISLTSLKKGKKIKVKNNIIFNDFLESIKRDNNSIFLFSGDWSSEEILNLYIKTHSYGTFLFEINLTKTDRSIIYFYYRNKNYNIGKYENYRIRQLWENVLK